MKARPAFSAVELITTTALLGLVCVACGLLVQSQARLMRQQGELLATSETLRSARAVLRADLRDLLTSDVRALASDSVAVRVFRGWGIVCARADTRVALRYHGLRDPDAAKDSMLLVGEERTLAFRQVVGGAVSCNLRAGEELTIVEPAAPLQLGSVALFFESGAYFLSTSALRYRRASEGRQPVTDQLIDTRRSRFLPDSDGRALTVRLRSTGNLGADAMSDMHIRLSKQVP